ncbi:hypothetical protein AVEN_118441-1 [Araneus ventricosus]|uniref:Uncharacterized protein n=1 Tax=Araneus ventricosus TaxID=182803 RepID=A0A4Y2HHR8_ARAVE|nr:hypothetical protein AVEN_118441-1 [Araneus ventricosus]
MEDAGTAVMKTSSHSPNCRINVLTVSRRTDMSYSTLRVIILHFYPHESKHVQQSHYADSEIRETFALKFLALMAVNVTRPWSLLWIDEPNFCLNGHINTRNC